MNISCIWNHSFNKITLTGLLTHTTMSISHSQHTYHLFIKIRDFLICTAWTEIISIVFRENKLGTEQSKSNVRVINPAYCQYFLTLNFKIANTHWCKKDQKYVLINENKLLHGILQTFHAFFGI